MSQKKDEVAQAEKGEVVKALHSSGCNAHCHFSSAFHSLDCGSQGKTKAKCQPALLGKTEWFISCLLKEAFSKVGRKSGVVKSTLLLKGEETS